MKILYRNLPFKTNRNRIAGLGAGVNAPNNLNNKLRSVKIKKLRLPKFVYHISRTPISQFTPNRIFYVSFDKKQSLLHMKQYLEEGLHNYPKIYLYTLKPRRRRIKAIIFDKKHRPKTISNTIGLKYNKYARSAMSKLMLGRNRNLTVNNISSENFKEGSGDNMILGHLLCSRTRIKGIRNSYNQDELAVCNPVKFFTIYDKEILDISGRTEPIPPKQSFLNKLLGKKPIIKNKYSWESFFPNVPSIVPRGSLPPGNAINIRRNGSIVFSRNAHKPMGYVSKINVLKLLNRYGNSKIQEAKAKQALRKLTEIKTGWKNLFSFRK